MKNSRFLNCVFLGKVKAPSSAVMFHCSNPLFEDAVTLEMKFVTFQIQNTTDLPMFSLKYLSFYYLDHIMLKCKRQMKESENTAWYKSMSNRKRPRNTSISITPPCYLQNQTEKFHVFLHCSYSGVWTTLNLHTIISPHFILL